jgi:hypothetical protein
VDLDGNEISVYYCIVYCIFVLHIDVERGLCIPYYVPEKVFETGKVISESSSKQGSREHG